MVLNLKKETLDGVKIGKNMMLTLALLSNNEYVSKEDIAKYVFNCNKELYNSYKYYMERNVNTSIYRLRKKGLNIINKNSFGFKLIDVVYIDY